MSTAVISRDHECGRIVPSHEQQSVDDEVGATGEYQNAHRYADV